MFRYERELSYMCDGWVGRDFGGIVVFLFVACLAGSFPMRGIMWWRLRDGFCFMSLGCFGL